MFVELAVNASAMTLNIPTDTVGKLLAVHAMGLVSRRVASGRDIYDRPFKRYSATYKRALALAGFGTEVDLSLSGGMLQSLHLQDIGVSSRGIRATVGLDRSQSRYIPLLPPWIHGRYKKRWAAKQAGKPNPNPPHNIVGAYLQHGTARMPPRPWLGLSPSDRKELALAMTLELARVVTIT